jgi:hypothetical protein
MATTPAGAVALPEQHRSGCNRNSCVHAFFTNANGYRTHGEANHLAGTVYGHFRLTGPGLDYNTPDRNYQPGDTSETGNSRGSGQVCAEFWMWAGDHWESIGKPCVNVG